MDVEKKRKKDNIFQYEEMAERFKAADCKSVEFSHRKFESYSLQITILFLAKHSAVW